MIVPLGREHVEAVARLHCSSLRGLLSELGIQAAMAYYTGCVHTTAAVGFVYLDEGVLHGYVLGSARPDELRRDVLRTNGAQTCWALCLAVLGRPSSLVWLLKSVRGPDEGTYNRRAAELIYLAVAPDRQTAGIGRTLVGAFTRAMRDAHVSAYELSVDDENERAIGFYERLGFRLVGRYREFGAWHRRYALGIEEPRGPTEASTVSIITADRDNDR